jgi:hypothetical protein
MKPCCLSGTLATGSPAGIESEIAGLPTYIAKPPNNSNSKTIIFLPDGAQMLHLIPPSPQSSPQD